jgi:ferric-dicitrate binding protein FerR (iron transport regulator)
MDALYQNVLLNRNRAKQPKVFRLNTWIPRIAAMFVVLLGAAFFLYAAHTTSQVTAAGQRDTFLLPDYSEVVLNAGSEADYKEFNWSSNRRLELNGEAYFKAAKGKTFDVVTPLGTVTVVGTQFNVKARNGRLDVTCFEGKVRVTSGNNVVLLTPGKSVAYKNGKSIDLEAGKNGTQPGWINNEAAFNTESLDNIISELERQYNITVKLNVTTVPVKHYTGVIPTNNMATALDIIQAVYHLKSAKAGNNTIILSSE